MKISLSLLKLFKKLYFQVIVSIIIGILLGYFYPSLATKRIGTVIWR